MVTIGLHSPLPEIMLSHCILKLSDSALLNCAKSTPFPSFPYKDRDPQPTTKPALPRSGSGGTLKRPLVTHHVSCPCRDFRAGLIRSGPESLTSRVDDWVDEWNELVAANGGQKATKGSAPGTDQRVGWGVQSYFLAEKTDEGSHSTQSICDPAGTRSFGLWEVARRARRDP